MEMLSAAKKCVGLVHFFIQVMPEDYDYNQELARAAFADMLHDSERNQLYRY